MSEKKVLFLGEEYTIPSELREFVGYLQYFEGLHNELLPLLTKQMNDMRFSGMADEDFVYFEKPMCEVGKKIIANLHNKGVYDITLDDLVYNNDGYQKTRDTCGRTMYEMVVMLQNSIEEFMAGYTAAYDEAESKLTGTGVSLWSSSAADLMLFSALESSVLQRQANKAEIEYQRAMESLNKRIDNKQEEDKRKILTELYYPGIADGMNTFISKAMECYLDLLDKNGLFDYSQVKQYDLSRSCSLLSNIEITDNIVGVLKQAFAYCPYNPEIYKTILDNDLIDFDTFETAKYLLQQKLLVSEVERHCMENKDDISTVKDCAKILASYKDEDTLTTLQAIYDEEISYYTELYSNMKQALTYPNSLSSWITENIADNAAVMCEMKSAEIDVKILDAIAKIGMISPGINDLCNAGILNREAFALDPTRSSDFNVINSDYYSKLHDAIIDAIPFVKKRVHDLRPSFLAAENKYMKAKQEIESKINTLKEEQDNLTKQKDSLSFFSFSKKEALTEKISSCSYEIKKLEEDPELSSLKKEFHDIAEDILKIQLS